VFRTEVWMDAIAAQVGQVRLDEVAIAAIVAAAARRTAAAV